jgi:hypothetical protein
MKILQKLCQNMVFMIGFMDCVVMDEIFWHSEKIKNKDILKILKQKR